MEHPTFDVLYIDDDPLMTELFDQFVRWRYPGWQTKALNDPLLLFRQLERSEIRARVWIIDIMMPEKNGVEIAAAIRQAYGENEMLIGYTALEPHLLQADPQYRGGLAHFTHMIRKNEGITPLLNMADRLLRPAESGKRK